MESHRNVSETGKKVVKSEVLEPRMEQESLTSKKLSAPIKKTQSATSSTVESPLGNKKTILKDKSNLPSGNIPITSSSPTSDPVSTGNDEGSDESWRKHHAERYGKLLSSTKIDYVDLGSKSLSTSSISTRQDSWFTNTTTVSPVLTQKQEVKRYQRTSWRSQKPLPIPTTDQSVATPKDIRARKIKFYPREDQEPTLKMWFWHHRFVYNQAVEASKANGYETNLKEYDLKKSLVTKENIEKDNLFLVATPYDIRAGAVFELCSHHKAEVTKSYKYVYTELFKNRKDLQSSITARDKITARYQITIDKLESIIKDPKDPRDLKEINRNQKKLQNSVTARDKMTGKHQTVIDKLEKDIKELETNPKYTPDIKFRQQRAVNLVIDIPKVKCEVKDGVISIYKTSLGSLRTREPIEPLQHDIKISWHKVQGWYLIIPYDKIEGPDDPADEIYADPKFISIDPGYRTFATGVDSDGCIKEFGVGWFDDLAKNFAMLDYSEARYRQEKLNEKNKGYTYKQRQRYHILSLRTKKIMQRRQAKINNKVNYMHKKITRQLSEYDTVLLPRMNSRRMLESEMDPYVKRMIQTGAHCRFHDYASHQLRNRLIKVCERLTTKTCAKCMNMYDIGKSKVYTCTNKSCGYVSDRDVNSAINILVKNLGELRLDA